MSNHKETVTINISTGSIIRIVVILLLLWFVYLIFDIILLVFISFILASAIGPIVERLYKYRIPRILSVLIIYLVVFGIITISIGILVPPISEEIGELAKGFPVYYQKFSSFLTGFKQDNTAISQNIQKFLTGIEENIGVISSNIWQAISGIFGGIAGFFLALVLTFFMAISEDSVKKIIKNIAPAKYQSYLINLLERIHKKMGLWVRGQVILSATIFTLTLIGLLALRVKFAWVLALIAGFTEIIPFIGPLIGALPAVFLGFTQSFTTGILVVVLYVIIQQLENNFIVPKIMSKTTGFNPIVVILVMLVGAKLAGILGAILAIPLTLAISVLIKDLYGEKEEGLPEADKS